MLFAVHALAALLMLTGPMLVATALIPRLKGSWRWFWAGGAVFVLSQVVHIPLNSAISRLFMEGMLPTPPEPLKALAVAVGLGLSAGLCEELARYIGLRTALKKARGWAAGVNLGLGHGGAEAMIIGAMSLLGLVNMIAIQQVGLEGLGVPEDLRGEVEAQIAQYMAQPLYAPLAAPLERAGAMCAHIGLNVLVMHAVLRGQFRLVIAAILGHTALNAGALLLLPYGIAAAEGWVLLCAAGALAGVYATRPPPEPEVAEVPQPLSVKKVSIEDAAEDLE